MNRKPQSHEDSEALAAAEVAEFEKSGFLHRRVAPALRRETKQHEERQPNMQEQTTKISLPPRAVVGITLRKAAQSLKAPRGVNVSPLLVSVPVRSVRQSDSGTVRQPEQAGSLSHELEARIGRLEAEIAELKQQRAGVPALPSTGAAAVIERLARERVERELAALVTAAAAKEPEPVRRRWWCWW